MLKGVKRILLLRSQISFPGLSRQLMHHYLVALGELHFQKSASGSRTDRAWKTDDPLPDLGTVVRCNGLSHASDYTLSEPFDNAQLADQRAAAFTCEASQS